MISLQALPSHSTLRPTKSQPSPSALRELSCKLLWRVILSLIDTKDFNPSMSWISKRLGIDIVTCNQAIEDLLERGFIRRSEKGYELCHAHESSDARDIGLLESYASYLHVSAEVSRRMIDLNNAYFYQSVISLKRSEMQNLIRELEAVFQKYLHHPNNTPQGEEVYGINLGACVLSSPLPTAPKGRPL